LDVAGLTPKGQEEVEQQQRPFIDDSTIEIDLVAELPDSYVSQPAEKLKLYRELDAIKDESGLAEFAQRLVDRFGRMPRAAEELLNVVRLRREAIRLGMERVKVKNGLMIVSFVGEQNSPYYKSDTFMNMLQKITADPNRYVLRPKGMKLAMTIRKIPDIESGYKILTTL
ncbi:MAG: TRCF domain-containing protein, partial [Rikenellaceae bacterium]